MRTTIVFLANLYIWVLFARVIIDFVRAANPMWRPNGFLVMLVEAVLTVTDPPLRFLRRFVPPLRIGSVALDLSFLILIFSVQLLLPLVLAFLPF